MSHVVRAGPGEKSTAEQHEEARQKLNGDEKPADVAAPSSIRQYIIPLLIHALTHSLTHSSTGAVMQKLSIDYCTHISSFSNVQLTHTHHTHTRLFNGPLSGTTQ